MSFGISYAKVRGFGSEKKNAFIFVIICIAAISLIALPLIDHWLAKKIVVIPRHKVGEIESLEIKGPIRNAFFYREGQTNMMSTETILEDIHEEDTDRQKAQMIWEFICDNFVHSMPGLEEAVVVVSPAKSFSVYGYGFCDDAASVEMALWEAAGLKARLWNLKGHVVSEVYYDGGWHMYDADFKEYFVNSQGRVIGVKDIIAHPEILNRQADRHGRLSSGVSVAVYRKLFSQKSRIYDVGHESIYNNNWNAQINLRDDERMIFYNRILEKYTPPLTFDLKEYPYLSAWGETIYEPDLADKRSFWELKSKDIDLENGWLKIASDKQKGEVLFKAGSSFLVLEGIFRARCLLGREGDIKVYYSYTGGKKWVPLETTKNDGGRLIEAKFDNYTAGQPKKVYYMHDYLIKVEMRDPDGKTGIKDIKSITRFQYNPRLLPGLQAGKNRINFISDSWFVRDKFRLKYKLKKELPLKKTQKPQPITSEDCQYYPDTGTEKWREAFEDDEVRVDVIESPGINEKSLGIGDRNFGRAVFRVKFKGKRNFKLGQIRLKYIQRVLLNQLNLYISDDAKKWDLIWAGKSGTIPNPFPHDTFNITELVKNKNVFYIKMEMRKGQMPDDYIKVKSFGLSFKE